MMKHRVTRYRRYIALLIALLPLFHPASAQESIPTSGRAISFVENRGQLVDLNGERRPEIEYMTGRGGVNLFFGRHGIRYVFTAAGAAPSDESMEMADATGRGASDTALLYRLDMELLGANDDARIVPEELLRSYCNYYLAHCPEGITHVRRYGRLRYRDIYEKIDLVIYSDTAGLKYDFIVHPGGRVSDIRIRYRGADALIPTAGGGVRVTNPLGHIEEGAPYSYQVQEDDDAPQTLAAPALQGSRAGRSEDAVATSYRVRDGVIGFDVARYDMNRTLVIDPGLVWSTYFGGGDLFGVAMNYGQGIAADGSGGIFMAGYTSSAAFPTTSGAFQRVLKGTTDAFVVKFTSSGDTLWSTYYGGSGSETGYGVAADRSGSVVIAGTTYSATDFPLLSAAQAAYGGGTTDAFVVKLDGAGVRQWSTYYGGSGNDDGYGVAVDSSREVVFTGGTTSANFPTLNPFQPARIGATDAFVVKLGPSGAKIWATYCGGSATQNGRSVAIDSSRNVFVTGSTSSANFPVAGAAVQRAASGMNDAFVMKLSSSGDTLWSTYFGGSDNDDGFGIITDASGSAFVVGTTSSTNFPVTAAALQRTKKINRDAFAVKLAGNGDTLWSTYLGGDNIDYGRAVAIDRLGNVLAAGYTTSTNFPITSDAYRATNSGDNDAFVVKLTNAAGDTLWSTYFGGNGADVGLGVTADEGSNIYLTGYASSTASFPITGGAVQGARSNSLWDAFAAKLGCSFVPSIARSGNVNFCEGDSIVLSASPGVSYRWSNGALTRSITVKSSGKYAVTVTDAAGCTGTSDSVPVQVRSVVVPTITPNNATTICDGDSVRLTASAGYRRYLWSTGPADTSASIVVKRSGAYTVTVTDANGCVATKGMVITVRTRPGPVITPQGSTTICEGDSVVLDASPGFNAYQWSNGANGRSVKVGRSGVYSVTVTDSNGCGAASAPVTVAVRKHPAPAITPSGSTFLCRGDSVTLSAPPGFASYLWSNNESSQSIRVGASGAYTVMVTDPFGCSGRSAELRITVNELPTPTITPSDSVRLCAGDSIVLVAPVGFASYLWSNNEATQGITIKEAGSYSVTVTDVNGCIGIAPPVVVRLLAAPSVEISGPGSVCPDRTVTYSVPAVDGVTYDWSVNGGSILSGAGTNTITVRWGGLGAGSVQLSAALPATGCSRTRAIAVSISNSLSPTIAPSRAPLLCEGDSVRLTAPAGYSSYRWSTGETTSSIVVRDTGSYTVTVADAGGCSGSSAPLQVRRSAPPRPVIASAALTFCEGDSTILSVPTGYASYQWSTGERGRTIVVRKGGSYIVTVVDSAGCSGASDAVGVVVNAAPQPAITGPSSICIGTGARFQVAASPGNSYTWRTTSGAIRSGQGTAGIIAEWDATGLDTVMVTETSGSTGCARTVGYPVVIDSVLRPSITGPASLCEGDTIVLAAPSGYASYRWSNGESTPAISVWQPGAYSVEVAEPGGCSGRSEEMIVTTVLSPSPSILPGGAVAICPGDSVVLDAGAGFRSYRWSTGDSSRMIAVRAAGRYAVTVTNAAGCSGASPDVVVILHPAPAIPSITRQGDTLIASDASAFQWSLDGVPIPGANARRHRSTSAGSYIVTITDANGCIALSSPFIVDAKGASTITIPAVEAAPGEHVVIPLILASSNNLDGVGAKSFSATIRFNATLLIPTGATPSGRIEDGDRIIPITGVRPSGAMSGELMRLELIAVLGDADSTPVIMETFEWNVSAVSSVVSEGVFRLRGICREEGTRLIDASGSIALRAVRPNPAGGMAEIEYEVVEQGHTRLVVSDLLGRTVALLLDEEVMPGRYVASLDVSALPAGIYLYALQTPTEKLARIMVVER